MTEKSLIFTAKSSMFGTCIELHTRDNNWNHEIASNLENNPLKNRKSKLTSGFWFRSPNIQPSQWEDTFKSLSNFSGAWNIKASLKDDTVTAHLWIEEREEAAMFAWSNLETWQKWSEAQEAESKETKKKPKLVVNDDGSIKVTVTAVTLDK